MVPSGALAPALGETLETTAMKTFAAILAVIATSVVVSTGYGQDASAPSSASRPDLVGFHDGSGPVRMAKEPFAGLISWDNRSLTMVERGDTSVWMQSSSWLWAVLAWVRRQIGH
jgi:hypothetical protein